MAPRARIGMGSQSNCQPWRTGKGELLHEYNAQMIPPAPEKIEAEWPEWGNYHQQAGWCATSVKRLSTLTNLCHFMATQNAHSRAIVSLPQPDRCVFWFDPEFARQIGSNVFVTTREGIVEPIKVPDPNKSWSFEWLTKCRLAVAQLELPSRPGPERSSPEIPGPER